MDFLYGRIKKGVKPFGGLRVKVVGFDTYPNGRRVAMIIPPGDRRAGWMHRDVREYNVEDVEMETTNESGKV